MKGAAILRPDRICGIAVIVCGVAVMAEASGYPLGELVRMGPGYLPLGLGALLSLLGIIILIEGWSSAERFPALKVRPILAIIAALMAWVLLVETAGFFIATSALIVIASLAEPGFRPVAVAGSALLICVAGWAIFVVGFGVPLPLWFR